MLKMWMPFTHLVIIGVVFFSVLSSIDAQDVPSDEDLETYSVSYEQHAFEVKAASTNGMTIDSIEVYPEYGSVLLTLDAGVESGNGELVILLPRELIDSKENGVDSEFLVIVDGFDVEYEEIQTTDTARMLRLPIPGDAFEIEIFGSEVIPEFPFGVVTIAASVAIGTVIVFHRKQFQ